MRTPTEEALFAQATILAANENDAAAAHRQLSLKSLLETGLPHRRIEEWKYTDVRSFWREPLPRAVTPDAATLEQASAISPAPQGAVIELVNGYLTGTQNLPTGIAVFEISATPPHAAQQLGGWKDAALALHETFADKSIVITIAAGTKIFEPLQVHNRYAGRPSAAYPRLIVELGARADIMLLETHAGVEDSNYACNAVTVITCGKQAKIKHTRVQVQGDKALNIVSTLVELAEDATYQAFALEEGAALSRNQYFIRQRGENALIDLAGVTLAKRKQHLDTTLTIDHTVPHSASREVFKQVLLGESRGVFQGKIIVRPHAQKTDGQMNARGLLLSEEAEFYAKPELEIYADDVLCAHGATAGALDDDLLFYLRARGLPEGAARALLVSAFVGEALEKIDFEPLREALTARCEAWLKESLN